MLQQGIQGRGRATERLSQFAPGLQLHAFDPFPEPGYDFFTVLPFDVYIRFIRFIGIPYACRSIGNWLLVHRHEQLLGERFSPVSVDLGVHQGVCFQVNANFPGVSLGAFSNLSPRDLSVDDRQKISIEHFAKALLADRQQK